MELDILGFSISTNKTFDLFKPTFQSRHSVIYAQCAFAFVHAHAGAKTAGKSVYETTDKKKRILITFSGVFYLLNKQAGCCV